MCISQTSWYIKEGILCLGKVIVQKLQPHFHIIFPLSHPGSEPFFTSESYLFISHIYASSSLGSAGTALISGVLSDTNRTS